MICLRQEALSQLRISASSSPVLGVLPKRRSGEYSKMYRTTSTSELSTASMTDPAVPIQYRRSSQQTRMRQSSSSLTSLSKPFGLALANLSPAFSGMPFASSQPNYSGIVSPTVSRQDPDMENAMFSPTISSSR